MPTARPGSRRDWNTIRAYARTLALSGMSFSPLPIDDNNIHEILVRSKIAVDKIRARSGDVVFLRPPSAPDIRAIEDKHIPRTRAWDAFLVYTHTRGTHADDLAAAQDLSLPEGSHLSHACAMGFTDAYIRSVARQTRCCP